MNSADVGHSLRNKESNSSILLMLRHLEMPIRFSENSMVSTLYLMYFYGDTKYHYFNPNPLKARVLSRTVYWYRYCMVQTVQNAPPGD
jgi:hypothetical protein